MVRARRVNAVLVADHFPELRADLVAALATLRGVVSQDTRRQFPFSTSDELKLIPLKSAVDVCAAVRLDVNLAFLDREHRMKQVRSRTVIN